MKIIDTIKWLWDPRTEKEKAYDKWNRETPLQRREQKIAIYIKNREEPIITTVRVVDFETGGSGTLRYASSENCFNTMVNEWLDNRAKNGIRIDSVWYSPETILRIELGESKLEAI